MQKIEKQQLIIIIVAVISLGAFGLLRYFPLANKTRTLKAARIKYQTGDERIKRQARDLPVLNAKMERYRAVVGNYENKIPTARNFASLYDEIGNIMKKHDLTDQLIQPANETVGNFIACIPISIECTGKLKNIFEFFKSLEKLERLIRIEKLELISKLEEDTVTVKASAKVYYRPAEGQDN